ncbi:MAG: hypothetical protein KDD89_00155 [Anaerolineales bacterium]|nr:hypothetical protein [Anaerolineales bacterium]
MSLREELEKQAQRAIFKKALLDWKIAASLATTISLTAFDTLFNITGLADYAWVWAVGGLSLAALFFVNTLRNPGSGAQAVAEMLREEFQPEELRSRDLQAKINEALDYHNKVMQAVEQRGTDSMLADELLSVADQMNDWIREMYGLAKRIDNYRQENRHFKHAYQRTQQNIQLLEAQLEQEDNEGVRAEISRNLDSLRYKLQTLDNIDDTMTRAMLMLDNQLTNMSTIYLQSTLMGAKEIDNSRAQRLREEIATEVQEMDDILLTMDEIYADSSQF